MALIVKKYGGTSVGTAERIQLVAEKVIETKKQGHQVVVVVSAMSGETNRLLSLADSITKSPNPRELDVLLSTGEQVTIALLTMALEVKGCQALSFTGGQVCIHTDSAHNKARIANIEVERVKKELQQGKVVVIAGFQGVNEDGDITTLGRGGSDTTDVDGVYTADPRIVENAQRLSSLTYEEMLEMASLGSKVLQTRAVEFAGKYNINLRVLSSFEEGPGTLITNEGEIMEAALISGIAHNSDEAKLTVVGVPDKPGIASTILDPIAAANIEVDMIVQNVGLNNSTDFTFTVHRNDYDKAMSILKETAKDIDATDVTGDNRIVKISVVGVGMRSHAGVASTIFKALADEKINIQMISTSEIKVSVVVDEKYLKPAVRVLHMVFDLGTD